MFAFIPVLPPGGGDVEQDADDQPMLNTSLANPLPTTRDMLDQMQSEPPSKKIQFKVGDGQHGTEATKLAILEKPYLKEHDHLMHNQTEIYAMGFLEKYLELRVMFFYNVCAVLIWC